MPSPIRVPIHHKLLANSDATASQEDVDDAIAAYLTPLLAKHDRGQPLIYEDLLESYEAAKKTVAASSGRNTKAKEQVEHLHESQLVAYEACARKELSELAQTRPTYPSIEDGESMPAYIERFVQTVHEDGKNQSFKGWRVSEELMDEVFWSKIKAGARRAYFTLKGQSIANTSGAKDEEGKGAETRKINAFEAAALGALVSKSESQDSEMAEEEENDMARDDEGDDDDCGEEEDGENDDAEEEDEDDDDDDDDDDDNGEGGDDEDADTEDAEVAAGNDVIPANSTVQSKKRRRLPNGPLGGGGNGNAEGGRKQHPAKKPKTGNGASGGTNGGGPGRGIAGGRGKGGTKNGKAGRGAGGGRGNRKRNRKKGTGAGAGGIA